MSNWEFPGMGERRRDPADDDSQSVLTEHPPQTSVLTMAQVSCRCGETIDIKASGPDRIDCPRCGARIRLRRRNRPSGSLVGASESADGFIRFLCPCGRRLKVQASSRPEAGKCPDCGRVVPVPDSAWSGAAVDDESDRQPGVADRRDGRCRPGPVGGMERRVMAAARTAPNLIPTPRPRLCRLSPRFIRGMDPTAGPKRRRSSSRPA